MSIETWKREFYPIPANQVTKNVLAHSLRKWEGLRKENLEKYGLRHDRGIITDTSGARFDIDGRTCALCQIYISQTKSDESDCAACPLYQVRNNTQCDECTDNEFVKELPSPYSSFTLFNDPEPMIRDLKRALKLTENL